MAKTYKTWHTFEQFTLDKSLTDNNPMPFNWKIQETASNAGRTKAIICKTFLIIC